MEVGLMAMPSGGGGCGKKAETNNVEKERVGS